jgi:hypothetical protein
MLDAREQGDLLAGSIGMPVSSRIAIAAQSFNQNDSFLKKTIDGLTEEEWLRRPCDHVNHMLWIVGHMAWARTMLLPRLNAPWTTPWMKLYARGSKCVDSPQCPNPQEAWQAWEETCARLNTAMEAASDELLNTPATQGPPSADGKLSGIVHFLAFHETYHVGQASYVRSWLGHSGFMGKHSEHRHLFFSTQPSERRWLPHASLLKRAKATNPKQQGALAFTR